MPRPPSSTLFPYTTLFRSEIPRSGGTMTVAVTDRTHAFVASEQVGRPPFKVADLALAELGRKEIRLAEQDRKSTRLNSSHGYSSYAVLCLKKKKGTKTLQL